MNLFVSFRVLFFAKRTDFCNFSKEDKKKLLNSANATFYHLIYEKAFFLLEIVATTL